MKKKLIFMPLSLLGVLALLQFGCSSDDTEDVCEAFTPPECKTETEATACCSDESSCYYLYNGKKYAYSDEGKKELIAVMCPNISMEQTSRIQEQMAAQTRRLIKEIRISSVCE
ncbi:MAG: hypothetical protein ACEPOZ_10875 [Marinifilaceae bacterium]